MLFYDIGTDWGSRFSALVSLPLECHTAAGRHLSFYSAANEARKVWAGLKGSCIWGIINKITAISDWLPQEDI